MNGNHPLLKMPNVLCMPHLGWAEWDNFELYFSECFEQIVSSRRARRCGSAIPRSSLAVRCPTRLNEGRQAKPETNKRRGRNIRHGRPALHCNQWTPEFVQR